LSLDPLVDLGQRTMIILGLLESFLLVLIEVFFR